MGANVKGLRRVQTSGSQDDINERKYRWKEKQKRLRFSC